MELKPSLSSQPGTGITVEDNAQHLLILLFTRHAWSLAPTIEIPELWPAPDVGNSELPGSAAVDVWNVRWRHAWARAWDWYQIEGKSGRSQLLQDEVHEISRSGRGPLPGVPPIWTAEYGWEGLDKDAFKAWEKLLVPYFANFPERQSFSDLIDAWRIGLDTVIVVPYRGYFARRISARHLVVSAATRNNPDSYRKALKTTLALGTSDASHEDEMALGAPALGLIGIPRAKLSGNL